MAMVMNNNPPGKFYFTVGQLIEILKALPQDIPVLVSGYKNGYENFFHPELATLKHEPDNWYTDGEFQVAEEGDEGMTEWKGEGGRMKEKKDGMSEFIKKEKEYFIFIQDIKKRVQSAQIKAAVSVNQELLYLYWDLGEQIVYKQKQAAWGNNFLDRMSKDLKIAFPEMKGFSFRNLKYIRQWYLFWSRSPAIGQQAVAQVLKRLRRNWEAMMRINSPGKFYFTVGQLIEILKTLPQDIPVLVSGYKNGYENFFHPELATLKHEPDNYTYYQKKIRANLRNPSACMRRLHTSSNPQIPGTWNEHPCIILFQGWENL